jgi:hypothetical protein
MVRPDFHIIISTLQVVAKYVQGLYNGKEFFVMDFIVVFCWLQRFRMIGYGCQRFRASGCSRMAPVAKSLASVMRKKGMPWSGKARTGAVVKASMSRWNADSCGLFHKKGTPFLVNSKRG